MYTTVWEPRLIILNSIPLFKEYYLIEPHKSRHQQKCSYPLNFVSTNLKVNGGSNVNEDLWK